MATQAWWAPWDRVRHQMTFRDLALDVAGKMVFAMGLGALFAEAMAPYAAALIAGGFALSLVVKWKYLKYFRR